MQFLHSFSKSKNNRNHHHTCIHIYMRIYIRKLYVYMYILCTLSGSAHRGSSTIHVLDTRHLKPQGAASCALQQCIWCQKGVRFSCFWRWVPGHHRYTIQQGRFNGNRTNNRQFNKTIRQYWLNHKQDDAVRSFCKVFTSCPFARNGFVMNVVKLRILHSSFTINDREITLVHLSTSSKILWEGRSCRLTVCRNPVRN